MINRVKILEEMLERKWGVSQGRLGELSDQDVSLPPMEEKREKGMSGGSIQDHRAV